MFICKFCNESFKDRKSLSVHLTRKESGNFGSDLEREKFLVETIFGIEKVKKVLEDYESKKICVYDLVKMGCDISKYIFLLGIKRTSKEERQTERYKAKYLEGIQKVYGTGITSISQVEAVKQKKKNTIIANHGSYEKFLSEHREMMLTGFEEYKTDIERMRDTTEKIQATCTKKYGHSNFGQGEAARAKSMKSRKELIATWDYEERLSRTDIARTAVCSRGGYESSIEKRVQHCLVELDINFVKHFHAWHYNYDLLVEGTLLIEIQGDMWHAFPGKYKATDLIMGKLLASDIWKKDAKKKKVAEENGYRVIYIWEHEIRKLKDADLMALVFNRIKEELNV